MIDGSRLSFFGKPAAIPSSIHARLRLSPSKCASFGSPGSGDTTGCNHVLFLAGEISGRKVRIQRANSWLGEPNWTRRNNRHIFVLTDLDLVLPSSILGRSSQLLATDHPAVIAWCSNRNAECGHFSG